MHWWVQLGYPDAFDAGEDGFPRTGQVVKYYRENGKSLTQSELAAYLGVTEQRVRDIENRDAALHVGRREFLCKLLTIPPVLLNIQTFEGILRLAREHTARLKGALDVEEYQYDLASCWQTYLKDSTHTIMPHMLSRIDALYRELPHAGREKQATIQDLLCRYHQAVAEMLKDYQMYNEAIGHLDKAFHFAEIIGGSELLAVVLEKRGNVWSDANQIPASMKNYEQAKLELTKLSVPLRFILLAEGGQIQARYANINNDREAGLAALASIDHAGEIWRTNSHVDNPYPFDFNQERYHITRGAILIEIGYNKDGINELPILSDQDPRKSAYITILAARAYMNLGMYDLAVAYAETGLVTAQSVNSKVNIARVQSIYNQLLVSPYKKSSDVARLGNVLKGAN